VARPVGAATTMPTNDGDHRGKERIAASGRCFPGDLVLFPTAIASLSLLLVNDHLLKERYANAVTGKLSDFAGLVFMPILLIALAEVGRAALGRRPWGVTIPTVTACVLLVGATFILVKTWAPATRVYGAGSGLVGWVIEAIRAQAQGSALPRVPAVHVVRDPTDLFALVALVCPWSIGRRRNRATTETVGAAGP
jgi:hypothetical protein